MTKDAGRALCERMTVDHKVTTYITHHQERSFVRLCGQLYNSPQDYERLADVMASLL
jgi:7-keto-8-aminopelargonate synthetase-like enzyme